MRAALESFRQRGIFSAVTGTVCGRYSVRREPPSGWGTRTKPPSGRAARRAAHLPYKDVRAALGRGGGLFVPVRRRVVLLVVLVMTVVMVLLLTRVAVHLVVVGVPCGARGGRQDELQAARGGGACRWPRRGQVSAVPPGSVRALRRVGRRLPGLSLTT